MAKNIPLTEFDLITISPLVQVAKAVIPFLDLQTQKTFSFMIRFYELQQTIQFFNKTSNKNPFECGITNPHCTTIHSFNDILSNEEILDTVIKYSPETYASMINGYRQFSKMSQMMDIFNSTGTNTSYASDSLDIASIMNLMNNFNTESATSTCNFTKSSPDIHSSNNTASSMQSFMNSEQQNLYQQYLNELDNLDFDNINPSERS